MALQIGEGTIEAYLRGRGLLGPGDATVESLGGGVSNVVLRVRQGDLDMVVKQALPRLAVADEWLADVERLEVEVACLRFLHGLLPGACPRLIFHDAGRHIYGMTTVPPSFPMWKQRLLDGHVSLDTARRVGELLAAIHGGTWEEPGARARFGETKFFYQLRVAPYYETTAERNPRVAAAVAGLIEEMAGARLALVHGDFSPKNLLVSGGQVVLLDYEVAHFGDPAFDTGFLINHLLLKAVHLPGNRDALLQAADAFWQAYRENLPEAARPALPGLERRTVRHLGALQLARVQGKSPAEYLVEEDEKAAVIRFGEALLLEGEDGLAGAFRRWRRMCGGGPMISRLR